MFVFRPLIPSVIPLLCQQALKCALSTFSCRFQQMAKPKDLRLLDEASPLWFPPPLNEWEMWICLLVVLRDMELKSYTKGSVIGAGRLRVEMMKRPGWDPKKQDRGKEVREWLRWISGVADGLVALGSRSERWDWAIVWRGKCLWVKMYLMSGKALSL